MNRFARLSALLVALYGSAAFAQTPGGTTRLGNVGVPDGGDVAQGTTTDTAWSSGAGTIIGILKAAVTALTATQTNTSNPITGVAAGTIPTGNNFVGQASGENHVGEYGWRQNEIAVSPTTTAVTYTAGQAIGALQSSTGFVRNSASIGTAGTGGKLQNVRAAFKSTLTGAAVDIVYFNANPTGSTCTNATAYSLAAADIGKIVAVVHVTDFESSAAATVGQAANLNLNYSIASGTTLWYCAVARASMALGTTTDATFTTDADLD